jgi:hypothetical protein
MSRTKTAREGSEKPEGKNPGFVPITALSRRQRVAI